MYLVDGYEGELMVFFGWYLPWPTFTYVSDIINCVTLSETQLNQFNLKIFSCVSKVQ